LGNIRAFFVGGNMQKNIALLMPPSKLEENYGNLSGAAPELPSLGLAFIAKYLKVKGIDCDLLDLSNNTELTQKFLTNITSYILVGMPAYITTVPNVISFSNAIKKANKNCFITVGGPHATLFPEDLHQESIDFIVNGEGEIAFYQLANGLLQNNIELSNIKGLHYKQNGNYIYNGPGNIIANLDELGSPLVGKYNYDNYYPAVHILGSKVIHTMTLRGCPFKCTFCAAGQIAKRRVRYRSVDCIIDEINNYVKLGFDSLIFYDDTFNINKQRVLELCKKIKVEKINVKWACFSRTDLVDRESLNYMRDAGCYLITFGCESGNDKTLKLLKKGITAEQNYKGIELVYEAGIQAGASFMIGLPGEDYHDLENTIEFAKKSKLTFGNFPVFEPFKGTPIYETCKTTGVWITDLRFKNVLLKDQEDIWVPQGLQRDEIEQCARRAYYEFYFRPEILARIAKKTLYYLPIQRKIRLINSAFQYFVIKNIFRTQNISQRRCGAKY
jgi:anaerobic magnesium-protoporphyrin IX monomethyl ester cyclase